MRRTAVIVSSVGLMFGLVLTLYALGNWNSYNVANGMCFASPQDCAHFHPAPPPASLLVSIGASAVLAMVSAAGLGVSAAYRPSRSAVRIRS